MKVIGSPFAPVIWQTEELSAFRLITFVYLM
jgi:hypothetical protein